MIMYFRNYKHLSRVNCIYSNDRYYYVFMEQTFQTFHSDNRKNLI